MAGCGLAAAAAVVPLGLVSRALARRKGEPVWPRWKPWSVPWAGRDVAFVFLVVMFVIPGLTGELVARSGLYQHVYGPDFPSRPVPPVEGQAPSEEQLVQSTLRDLWVGLLALPVQFALLIAARRALYPAWKPSWEPRVIPSRVALAALAWVVLTPLVMLVHGAVLLAFEALNWTPDEHPLVKLGSRPALDRVMFVLRVCAAAPLVEEVLFRGVLLPWVRGRMWRPWVVLLIGLVVAVGIARQPGEWFGVMARGPVLFTGGLLLGWVVLSVALRRKRRTVGAVYASAALFAAVHSGVWPSPVPLFVLGLGLGYLAARTRGFLVPAAVHGLFNAVSVLFVLSSPG
jgi:membrane protease YdiL (CAAX protease family)